MKKKQKIISISAILGITITTFILINSSKYISTDNAKIKISNIQISSDVSGFVSKIFAQENDFVKKDQEIDLVRSKRYLLRSKRDPLRSKRDLLRSKRCRRGTCVIVAEFSQLS